MNQRSNQQIGTAPRSLKLSPNCVAASDFRAGKSPFTVEKLSAGKEIDLNVPSIHTPQGAQRSVQKLVPSSMLPPKAPPLPPRNPLTGRPRSVSESEASMTRNRRAIFGQYWDNKVGLGNNGNTTAADGSLRRRMQIVPPSVRKRSSSISILESAPMPDETIDYRMYGPPKEHSDTSAICSRFAPVDAIPALETLPPLPTPLRRLCSEGGAGCLHGMYPLVTPVPILKQSSYRSMQCDTSDSSPSTQRKQSSLSTELDDFNLTRSYRYTNKDLSFTSHSSSSMSNSERSAKSGRVHFDPRITVTEFEDSVERAWYDDFELMRLKHETVLLAQEYLMTHQHETEKYNKVTLDPVTGTYRKRALFSLPVLASTIDDDTAVSPGWAGNSEIADLQVKNVLVVDPNPSILELFRKSLKSMFPRAEIHTSRSGEEALKLTSAQLYREYGSTAFQHRNFDIIVVEQRLSQDLYGPKALKEQERTNLTENRSCLSMASMGNGTLQPRKLHKPHSFAGGGASQSGRSIDSMCGSDLITAIQKMEADVFASSKAMGHGIDTDLNTPPSNETALSMPTKPIQWRSLLIGVSMQPDRDAGVLTEAGADVIWGKPIPHIGNALRNQLVQSLVNKRRRCTVESQ